MACKPKLHYRIASLFLLLPLLATEPATAQATSPNLPTRPIQISLNFKVPKRGAPPSTAGGASRGSCVPNSKLPQPLLPTTRLGLTVSEHPSFFVYVPTSPAQTAGFLLLSDNDTEVVYETTFALPKQAGIARFNLPPNATPLEVGKQYHWFITTLCDATIGVSGSPTAEGWIERTEPDVALTKALEKSPLDNRATLYAEAGIWHDTLTTLADLRQQYPHNAKLLNDWKTLLQSVGLNAIASEPLVNQ